MPTDAAEPLDGIDPNEVAPDDVDESAVRAALASENPLTRRRGTDVCDALAAADVDSVDPFLDALAPLADDTHSPVALGAIGVLDAVAGERPGALDGRIAPLADAVDAQIVDVQLTGATVFGKVVVDRPELVAPHVPALIRALRATEPTRELTDFGDVVDDPDTRRTLQQHEAEERERRMSARRTLVNVVVAAAETAPAATPDVTDGLTALLTDVDPGVAGGAADALAELAAADPESVTPAVEPLIDSLDHDRAAVRLRAVRALGHVGATQAVSRLRELAADDESEDVREIAGDTADFLDESA